MKKLCLVKKNNDKPSISFSLNNINTTTEDDSSNKLENDKMQMPSIKKQLIIKKKTSSVVQVDTTNIVSEKKKIFIPKKIVKKVQPEDYLPHPVEYYSWCKEESYIDKENQEWVLPHSKRFPEWIFKHYEKYKLDEIIEEPKNELMDDQNILSTKTFLYQEFIASYINPMTPYRSILLDHGLGSGKTKSSIKVAEKFREANYDIICLLPASLKNNYIDEIKIWGNEDLRRPSNYDQLSHLEKIAIDRELTEKIKKKYNFVSYNSNVTHKKIKELKLKNALIIIDEVHNFVNLLCSKTSKYAKSIYRHMMSAENCRFVALSGSPILNGPFSIAILFNILKGYMTDPVSKKKYTLFPEEEEEFDELFINKSTNSMKNIELFKKRISGIVSNYKYKQNGLYPDIIIHEPIFLEMSEHQFNQYYLVRTKEKKTENNAIKFGKFNKQDDSTKSYRSQSRQYCNFSFPSDIERPKTLSAKSNELNKTTTLNKESRLWITNQVTILKSVLGGGERYKKFIRQYEASKSVKERLLLLISIVKNSNKINSQDKKQIISDTEIEWINNPNFYDDAIKKALDKLSERPNDLCGESLRILSCKMAEIIKNMESGEGSEGLKFVYSCFRSLEGIEIFSRVLKAHGYELLSEYNIDKLEEIGDKKRFAIVSGQEDPDVRSSILSVMIHPNNMYGKYCSILLGSSATAEGISLKYMRQVYIMEPWWNDIKIDQVTGRACRLGSHLLMPLNEKNLHVYRYMTTLTYEQQIILGEKYSTDEYIYKIAENKKRLCEQFLQQLRDGAVDSMLNYNHNSKSNVIKPFFYDITNTGSETDQYMYIPNIHLQNKRNNFSNNENSILKSSITEIDSSSLLCKNSTELKNNSTPITKMVINSGEQELDPDANYIYTTTIYTSFDPGIEYESSIVYKLYNSVTKEPLYIYKLNSITMEPLLSKLKIDNKAEIKKGMILYDRNIHNITNKFAPSLLFIPEDGYGFMKYTDALVY